MYLSKYNAHIAPLLSSASLLDFTDLINFNNAVFAYKYKHGLLPKTFNNVFSYSKDSSNNKAGTRARESDGNFLINTAYSKVKCPYNYVAMSWNMVPYRIKNEPTLSNFKSELKKYMVSRYDTECCSLRCYVCHPHLFKKKSHVPGDDLSNDVLDVT